MKKILVISISSTGLRNCKLCGVLVVSVIEKVIERMDEEKNFKLTRANV